jgi:hypothetical protein
MQKAISEETALAISLVAGAGFTQTPTIQKAI